MLLMIGFIAILDLAFIATVAPAMACVGVQTYEDRMARWSGTPEQIDAIIDRSEIIVDGVISRYDAATPPPQGNGGTAGARLRITKVWKGEVDAEVPLYMPGYLIGCTLPPQYDTAVRLAGSFYEERLFLGHVFFSGTIGLPLGNPLLDRKLREYQMEKPVLDAERDRQMERLRVKTEALRQATATGDVQARIDFAAHLLTNNQRQRAQEVADALRRDGVKLASFGALKLTGERKDWSDLKRIHDRCYGYHGQFDDAVFDRADLAKCAFRYSSFRNASFRGTDLSGSYFQNSDITGAKYDCATKLPDDLDPVATGMINVEGECHAP